MSIQKLYNRFIKKANMQKVAGWRSRALKYVLGDINYIRGNKKVVKALSDVPTTWDIRSLDEALRPFKTPNEHLNISKDIHKLKLPFTHPKADGVNKLIDKINDYVTSRKRRIGDLGGQDTAKAFEQSLINKYIKDIPSK